MADRYWVGGVGIWDATTATNWSATSGGAGGASAPTSADNAIFDTLSGLVSGTTVTITGGVCANLTYTPTTAVGYRNFFITSTLTINGTFSTSSTAGNVRLRIRSGTAGIATNMVVASIGSISDIDFVDIYVTGVAAPLTGTRLGNVANGQGVTFSTPKTVYWNLAGAQNWSANGWAATSGGTPSTNYFPLVQDTAVFDNTGSVTGTITMDAAFIYYGNIDMSARTTAMTIATGANNQIYGNWTNGSGTAFSGTTLLIFQSRTTQTITSAGKTWLAPITVNTYGGTVALGDAITLTALIVTITSGNFVTNGYAVTASQIASNVAGPRSISLGASSVTLSNATPLLFTAGDGLTFNAGTSTITVVSTITAFPGLGFTYYDLSIPSGTSTVAITGANTFRNLTVVGARTVTIAATQTFTGSLVYVGAPTTRLTFASDTTGTPRTVVMNGAFSSTNIDFRDIAVTGTAAPISGATLGNLGGNSGITFTTKTVYWNLAGAQNWDATGWALTSGGTPNAANFPLAQDTAVFDNTGSVTGTITFVTGYAYPNIDMSARTTAMTLATVAVSMYGDWKNGSGTTLSGTGILTFAKRGTQTITSSGKTFTQPISIDSLTGTTQLADAFTSSSGFVFTTGTFSASASNVTSTTFTSTGVSACTVNMGSGTWTATGTGAVWNFATVANLTLNQNTANILLSNTTTTARTFAGGGLSYNKLTIGGATGTSTTTFSGANTFTELASTKTVAHTVALSTTTQVFGKWTITGTVGNVVTVSGAGQHIVAGARVSGVDYLAMGTTSFSAGSGGEFYAGANSTGTGQGVILTTAPAAVTRYWVGGTGNWDAATTTHWSATSGGAGGASVPTSVDTVIFDTLSNATAYTMTLTSSTGTRFGSLTMGAPLTGNITWAGTAILIAHNSISLTGGANITRTFTGTLALSGSTTGSTLNTNGVTLASAISVATISGGWVLASALVSTSVTISRGSFDTAGYSLGSLSVPVGLIANSIVPKTLSLGASTVYASITFGSQGTTFNAGTSTLNVPNTLAGVGFTYYNVNIYSTDPTTAKTITGANTFNNLSVTGPSADLSQNYGYMGVYLSNNQIVNGVLSSTGTNAIARVLLTSSTTGVERTLTVNGSPSITDIDFRDISVIGITAPISGTRLGDQGGNSGITFTSKTVYWNLAGTQNWSSSGWAGTSGGTPAQVNFPLPQDTAVFNNTGSLTTINIEYEWALPTVDMSTRTTAMTLAGAAIIYPLYGDWKNGSGTTITGVSGSTLSFAKRGTQTITSAGKTFTSWAFTVNSINGTVQLADALIISGPNGLTITSGTFNNIAYTATVTSSGGATVANSAAAILNIGTGGWVFSATSGPTIFSAGALSTVTYGSGATITISQSNTFAGGGQSYPKLIISGGIASTLTITGNNTFAEIASTKTIAATLSLAATIQTVGAWTAAGTAGKLLTVSGTSVASLAYLVLTGAPTTSAVDYLSISNVRATPLATTWYAGANSVNNGSLGWIFAAGGGGNTYAGTISESATGTDAIAALVAYFSTLSETATGTDAVSASANLLTKIAETSTGTDSVISFASFYASAAELATATDVTSSVPIYPASLSETATATDANLAGFGYALAILEAAAITDATLAGSGFYPSISEAVTATDANNSVVNFATSVTETATTTDVDSTLASFVSAANETATAADASATKATLNSLAVETATATEIQTAAATFPAATTDTATATDTPSLTLTLPASLNETATATDANDALRTLVFSILESAAATDINSALQNHATLILETATATDISSTTAIFTPNIDELATATDFLQAGFVLFRAVNESATATDVVASSAVFLGAISEAATGSDDASTNVYFFAVVPEIATATDSLTAVATFNAFSAETVTATENINAPGSIYNTAVLVAVTITDNVIGAYLWNPIDDNQTPSWQNVTDTQSPGWTPMTNVQTASWQNVNDAQTPGWSTVPTPQNPDWNDA